jgi:hypothetical protein
MLRDRAKFVQKQYRDVANICSTCRVCVFISVATEMADDVSGKLGVNCRIRLHRTRRKQVAGFIPQLMTKAIPCLFARSSIGVRY